MKIYSKPHLLIGAGLGVGVPLLCAVTKMTPRDPIYVVLWGLVVGMCLYTALSPKGYAAYRTRSQRDKRVGRKLFGKWAPVAPWLPVILIVTDWALLNWVPATPEWITTELLVFALAYTGWYFWMIRKHTKKLEEEEAD